MPLPRSRPLLFRIPLRYPRHRFLSHSARLRLANVSPSGTSPSDPAPPPPPPPQDDKLGHYAFVGGQYKWISGTGIRSRMEAKEIQYRNALEKETSPDQPVKIYGVETEGGMSMEDEDSDMLLNSSDFLSGDMPSLRGFKPLNKGDLCELRYPGGIADMGVYLRPSKGGDITTDFLTPWGQVKPFSATNISFSLDSFVSEAAVDSFMAYYDKVEQFEKERNGEQRNTNVVATREYLEPLLGPAKKFMASSNDMYKLRLEDFSGLYNKLAHDTETVKIELDQASEMIFGGVAGKNNLELYTTHKALMGDGLRYMGDRGFHRHTKMFRVRSRKDFRNLKTVTDWLRKHPRALMDRRGERQGNKQRNELDDFVEKAKRLIAASRKMKYEPPDGSGRFEILPRRNMWSKADRMFIQYVQSRLSAYGLQVTPESSLVPYILHKTGMYEDGRKKVDGATAYEFLTEIGVYTPWYNTALESYTQRLPGMGVSEEADKEQRMFDRVQGESLSGMGLQDSLSSLRKDWGDMPVFTIDDANAHEIDDGVSIEEVNANETWVHVHIANPTAFLEPDHWISRAAMARGTTKYLTPYTFPMLPEPFGRCLGVAKDGPVLTISTKINKDGETIDYEIQPGIARNVHRITYDQVGKLLGIPEGRTNRLVTGVVRKPEPPPTPDLSPYEISCLKAIQRCALASMKARARNDALRPRAAYFQSVVEHPGPILLPSEYPTLAKNFPAVEIHITPAPRPEEASIVSPNELVAECMVLANSTVARFGTRHKIPLPFRTMTLNLSRPDIIDDFRNSILPTRDALGHYPNVYEHLPTIMLLCTYGLSSVAGSHVILGLDEGYVKATSPLRRHLDMVAHWNIQSHFLSKPLPFPEKLMESVIPKSDIAERHAQFGSSETERFWLTATVNRLVATGKETFINDRMKVILINKKEWPMVCQGVLEDVGCTVKLVFADRKQQTTACVGQEMVVTLQSAGVGEKYMTCKVEELL